MSKQKFIIRWFINTIVLYITVQLIGGMEIQTMLAVFLSSLVLTVLNITLRPILFLISLPLTILTVGIFYFVISGLMIYISASLIKGFSLASFGAAFWGAVLMSIIGGIANYILYSVELR